MAIGPTEAARTSHHCVHCGAPVGAADPFCTACGKPTTVTPPNSSSAGRRRHTLPVFIEPSSMVTPDEHPAAHVALEETRNQGPSLSERARTRKPPPAVVVRKAPLDGGTLIIESGLVDARSEPALQATLSLPGGELLSITLGSEGDRLIMGRDPEHCDLIVSDARVSRQHLALGVRDGTAYVQDLGSANGTFLNGLKISGRESLYDGDVLRLGQIEIGYWSK